MNHGESINFEGEAWQCQIQRAITKPRLHTLKYRLNVHDFSSLFFTSRHHLYKCTHFTSSVKPLSSNLCPFWMLPKIWCSYTCYFILLMRLKIPDRHLVYHLLSPWRTRKSRLGVSTLASHITMGLRKKQGIPTQPSPSTLIHQTLRTPAAKSYYRRVFENAYCFL